MTYDNRTETYGASTNSYEGQRTTSSYERVTRRFIRRRNQPRKGLWPWGTLGLGLLGLSLLFGLTTCASSLETEAKDCAETVLAEKSYDWANVIGKNGRWIKLTGTQPSGALGASAKRAVSTACEDKGRITRLSTDFDTAPIETTPVETTPVVVPTPAVQTPTIAEVERVNPDWTFRLRDGILRLEGEVPDEATRREIIDAARAAIDPPRIVSVQPALQLTGKPADFSYRSVAMRGVNTISRCEDGVATLRDETFSLNCELEQSRVSIVNDLANDPMPFGRIGVIDILPTEQLEVCESSMRALLTTSDIKFASGSARILDSSSDLLDQLAEAARLCPGRLQIDGHTDNVGEVSANLALSRQRAASVRSALVRRNVDARNLSTVGYGESRPIAENTTPEGRARNRRTEINVVRTTE